MAVFFGETATTFDQAPFRNSASASVASSLYLLLTQQEYSETALQGLANFISAPASVGISNESNVHDISVQGEILSAAPGLRIGTATSLTHGAPDLLMAISLHSQALLSAFVQNNQFREVTFTLPDAVRMIFDSNLFEHTTARSNATNEDFIERLVRHQNGIAGLAVGETPIPADAMLTRFTDDLRKLALNGGLTMSEGTTLFGNLNNVSKALTAFAMQKYYDETQLSVGYKKELFTAMTGGVQFDRADVAATLGNAKGYTLYFQDYLNSDAFTNPERQLIQSLLPTLRDWYVQAGLGGMNVADPHNRGAFMLGGTGADNLTGGTQTDLLVGNAGTDTLNGGGGNDTLLGGSGFDTYVYNTGDGTDVVNESDELGRLLVNGQLLSGGIRRAGDDANTFHSTDNAFTFVQSGTTRFPPSTTTTACRQKSIRSTPRPPARMAPGYLSHKIRWSTMWSLEGVAPTSYTPMPHLFMWRIRWSLGARGQTEFVAMPMTGSLGTPPTDLRCTNSRLDTSHGKGLQCAAFPFGTRKNGSNFG